MTFQVRDLMIDVDPSLTDATLQAGDCNVATTNPAPPKPDESPKPQPEPTPKSTGDSFYGDTAWSALPELHRQLQAELHA